MATEAREIAQQFLSDDQQSAMRLAEELYAGEAKIALFELLTDSLALDEASSTDITNKFGNQMEDLRFTEKREISDHLRAVARILGPAALENSGGVVTLLREDVDIVVQPDVEPTKDQVQEDNDAISNEAVSVPEGIVFDQLKNEQANVRALELYGEEGVRRIALLKDQRINIDGKILPIARNITAQQIEDRTVLLSMLLNNRGRAIRPSELKQSIPTLGAASMIIKTLSKHLSDANGKTIIRTIKVHDKLYEYVLTDDLVITDERLAEHMPDSGAAVQQSPDDAATPSHQAPEPAPTEFKPEVLPINKACELVADQLGLSSLDEYQSLRYMFEKGKNSPNKGVVDDVRDLLKELYSLTIKSPFALLDFTQAETSAFEYVLGVHNMSDIPLPTTAIEARMSRELAMERVTLDTVISTALHKFAVARQQIKDYERTKS